MKRRRNKSSQWKGFGSSKNTGLTKPFLLGERAVIALLVSAGGAGGANDNHATALATVLEGRHLEILMGGKGSNVTRVDGGGGR